MKQLAFSQISPVCLFLSEPANPTLLQCFFLTPRQPPCLDQDMEFVKTATSSICVNSFPDRVANLLWALAAKTQHGKVAEFQNSHTIWSKYDFFAFLVEILKNKSKYQVWSGPTVQLGPNSHKYKYKYKKKYRDKTKIRCGRAQLCLGPSSQEQHLA